MLFVSMTHAKTFSVEAVELRLDLFSVIDIQEIKQYIALAKHPVMLTLRSTVHGGKFYASEEEREALILRLLSLEPPFFDLEYDMRPAFIHNALQRYAKTKFVLSSHEMPQDLDTLYSDMAQYPAFSYKIACATRSVNEALKMLLFARDHPKVSVVCMGEQGQFARVLGPLVGNLVDFTRADQSEETGLGQLTVSEMRDVYHYHQLHPKTALYGLIGNPVTHSIGHRHHNGVFRKNGVDAVYVKMAVEPHELPVFLPLAQQLGVRGLSVTAPLKECILPYLQEIDPKAREAGAVNTLLFKQQQVCGFNTDGVGALDAMEKHSPVRAKKIVLIGAGGAARAVACEAKQRGAEVTVLNRTPSKALQLAESLGCSSGGLDSIPAKYDILVNCTCDAMPIDPDAMRPGTLAMDIVYSPRETVFLREAKKKGCRIIYGEEMYVNQAERQTQLWMNP